MATTPDRRPGPTILEDQGIDPSNIGEITNNSGNLLAKDANGVFNLRQPSSVSSSLYFIPNSDVVSIPLGTNFLVVHNLDIEGRLELDGRLVEVT